MKKLICPLLLAAVALVAACSASPTVKPTDMGAVVQTRAAAPSLSSESEDILIVPLSMSSLWEPEALEPLPSVEEEETFPFNEKVPLSHEEQIFLMDACLEYDVPYALALGLIEKETNFRNVIGDDGASTGYMQIQRRWHWDRMERIGVTDLLDPQGNFRVGCDYLAELYTKYDDWGMALTVYNMGHSPGYVTNYAYDVLDNYASWKELVEIYE